MKGVEGMFLMLQTLAKRFDLKGGWEDCSFKKKAKRRSRGEAVYKCGESSGTGVPKSSASAYAGSKILQPRRIASTTLSETRLYL